MRLELSPERFGDLAQTIFIYRSRTDLAGSQHPSDASTAKQKILCNMWRDTCDALEIRLTWVDGWLIYLVFFIIQARASFDLGRLAHRGAVWLFAIIGHLLLTVAVATEMCKARFLALTAQVTSGNLRADGAASSGLALFAL
ncbi:hypothetical protein BZM27_44480 [Paraburkholderia steynii]|uniref:Uncharacterized protein n=1 Tax=Paraburkholderia steynii TaxID=1245441 RepID=A0A4R0X2A3_9BURK|nr:hypothetical protein BZM27_44480 [Paraburkholderia steynii]